MNSVCSTRPYTDLKIMVDPKIVRRPNVSPAKLQNAKRVLFGSDGCKSAINTEFVRRELEKDMDSKQHKWNFDFKNEVPLHGKYKWEIIPPNGQLAPIKKYDCVEVDNADKYFSFDIVRPIPRHHESKDSHIEVSKPKTSHFSQSEITSYFTSVKKRPFETTKASNNHEISSKKSRLGAS